MSVVSKGGGDVQAGLGIGEGFGGDTAGEMEGESGIIVEEGEGKDFYVLRGNFTLVFAPVFSANVTKFPLAAVKPFPSTLTVNTTSTASYCPKYHSRPTMASAHSLHSMLASGYRVKITRPDRQSFMPDPVGAMGWYQYSIFDRHSCLALWTQWSAFVEEIWRV